MTRLRWARDEIRRIPSGWRRESSAAGARASPRSLSSAGRRNRITKSSARATSSTGRIICAAPITAPFSRCRIRRWRVSRLRRRCASIASIRATGCCASMAFSSPSWSLTTAGNLPLSADPKTIWAQAHPDCYPMEVNRASREELLRIPGIGPESAARIVKLRRESKFRNLSDLSKVGAVADRALPLHPAEWRASASAAGALVGQAKPARQAHSPAEQKQDGVFPSCLCRDYP